MYSSSWYIIHNDMRCFGANRQILNFIGTYCLLEARATLEMIGNVFFFWYISSSLIGKNSIVLNIKGYINVFSFTVIVFFILGTM